MEVELVIMPQPRFTVALPPALIPVVAVLMRLIAQYFPAGTIVAVAVAVIVGAALRNKLEKLNERCIETLTLTALLSAV
jgi:hypothetical protein